MDRLKAALDETPATQAEEVAAGRAARAASRSAAAASSTSSASAVVKAPAARASRVTRVTRVSAPVQKAAAKSKAAAKAKDAMAKEAAALLGRAVHKKFGEEWHGGTIVSYVHPYLKVVYHDGDSEEVDVDEARLLVANAENGNAGSMAAPMATTMANPDADANTGGPAAEPEEIVSSVDTRGLAVRGRGQCMATPLNKRKAEVLAQVPLVVHHDVHHHRRRYHRHHRHRHRHRHRHHHHHHRSYRCLLLRRLS